MATASEASFAPDPMIPRVALLRSRRHVGQDVWTLGLQPPDDAGPHFEPGQFSMLTAFGVGEIAVSLSGDPVRAGPLQHTVRAVGPVSRALTRLHIGAALGWRGPFGVGWPLEAAHGRDVLIVAGGLGLAPLHPLLHRLRAERSRYGRVAVLYGSRSPRDLLFARELERWRTRSDFDVQLTVDHAAPGWTGNVGVVTTLLPRTLTQLSRAVAYVCGPEVMMRLSIAALCAAGMPDEAIHLSIERNMKCAVALCGHCQLATALVCRDGPVFRYDRVRALLAHREL